MSQLLARKLIPIVIDSVTLATTLIVAYILKKEEAFMHRRMEQ